jgi:hypothetical protein
MDLSQAQNGDRPYAMAVRLEGHLCAVYHTTAESLSLSEAQGFIIQFLANFNNLNLLPSFSVEFWSRDQHKDWINGRLD